MNTLEIKISKKKKLTSELSFILFFQEGSFVVFLLLFLSFCSVKTNLHFDFGFIQNEMVTEVLINIQANRKHLHLLLSFLLREVFYCNALGSLKTWEKRSLKLR